jgi:tetratricopeptide (TPR) repeat protein
MHSARLATRQLLTVAALVLAAGLAGAAPAPDQDEAALRKRALALNDVTGDEAIKGQVLDLVQDAAGTRKLLPVALAMSKDKKQPFNYNAAYILGSAARRLKDVGTAKAFYRLAIDLATKLGSGTKMAQAYGGLSDMLYENKMYDETEKLLKEVLELTDEGAGRAQTNALLRMVNVLAKQRKFDEAYKLIDNLSKAKPDYWLFLELKAGVQREQGKFEEAAKTYEAMMDSIKKDDSLGEKDKTEMLNEVRIRLVGALAKSGKFDDAYKLIDELSKDKPGYWAYLELKAEVQREEGKFEAAAKTYEAMMDSIKKDDSLKDKDKADLLNESRYLLSNVYLELNDIKKTGEYLEALLAQDPDNPTYNNDLGYIWADHNMNLEKSEKMIRKALEEDRKRQLQANPELKPEEVKDNAAYLDSLAWVLFKQGKFKEAKTPILEAVKDKEGQHIEIYDHLGDIHLALGEKDEAQAAWKKALELPADTKRDKQRKTEVEKKVKMLEK